MFIIFQVSQRITSLSFNSGCSRFIKISLFYLYFSETLYPPIRVLCDTYGRIQPGVQTNVLSQLTRSQSDQTCLALVCWCWCWMHLGCSGMYVYREFSSQAGRGVACCHCWLQASLPGVPISAPVELALAPASAQPFHSVPAGCYQKRPRREKARVSCDRRTKRRVGGGVVM